MIAGVRLQKYLAHAGVASRRASEQLIADGRVQVNGITVTDPATGVDDDDQVAFDGELVKPATQLVVLALNKPMGVVSTSSDTHDRPTVVELVARQAKGKRLYPIGRLDVDTTGLILLTNDGEFANLLTHPRHGVSKTYVAETTGRRVDPLALKWLAEGVELEDGITRPAVVKRINARTVQLSIKEGRKRQIRRMFDEIGYPLRSLTRISIGDLELGDLKVGKARTLSPAEIESLRSSADRGIN